MRTLALIIGLVFGSAAFPVHARGIDCTKASTRLDKAICADPVKIEYDTRIAAAYDRALKAFDGAIASYVRLDQKTWLERFRLIDKSEGDENCNVEDSQCIREEMFARMQDVESGSYQHSGIYRSASGMKLLLAPRYANGYFLRVFNPAKLNVHIATLNEDRAALWNGTEGMVSKMGDGNGLPMKDACTLWLEPKPLSIRVTQTGRCGGTSYVGTYTRQLGETLADYEVDLH